MKKVFDHLPQIIQDKLFRISLIIREVVDAEKIILYGSHADSNSQGSGNNEFDLLIVTGIATEKRSAREAMIVDRVQRLDIQLNLELHEIKFINDALQRGQLFFSDMIVNGIVVYDSGHHNFADAVELNKSERKVNAQQFFDTWFPQALEFIIDARSACMRGNFRKAAFELHQAAEWLYSVTLLVFTDYKPKTHNLSKLRKKSKALSKELFEVFTPETDAAEKHLFNLLQRGYVDARYRLDYSITKEEITVMMERVQRMAVIVENICTQQIHSFD